MSSDSFSYRVAPHASPEYLEAADLVTAQYKRHFDADCHHPFQASFNVYEGNALVGCAGFSGAGNGPLFLEQYLDASVDEVLQTERNRIVEIGGLALAGKQFALPLMMELAPVLQALGFDTAVCTVTRPVRECLAQLGLPTQELGSADPARIQQSTGWGKYYELDPRILAGSIEAGNSAIGLIRPFVERRAA